MIISVKVFRNVLSCSSPNVNLSMSNFIRASAPTSSAETFTKIKSASFLTAPLSLVSATTLLRTSLHSEMCLIPSTFPVKPAINLFPIKIIHIKIFIITRLEYIEVLLFSHLLLHLAREIETFLLNPPLSIKKYLLNTYDLNYILLLLKFSQ